MAHDRERQKAQRAVDRGDELIEYRGATFEVEDTDDGWIYLYRGNEVGTLEQVFKEIDAAVRREKGARQNPSDPAVTYWLVLGGIVVGGVAIWAWKNMKPADQAKALPGL